MNTRVSENWQLSRRTVLAPGRTSRRQFFFTADLPPGARNVRHVYAPVEKLGVVMAATEIWEAGNVATFCGSIVRLDDGRYRMYYTAISLGGSHIWIAVAESVDGLVWEKPSLGQHKMDNHHTNRIVFENFAGKQDSLAQPQVLRLPDGRWRMYFWHNRKGSQKYIVAHSKDGLRWRIDAPSTFVMIDHWLSGKGSESDGWTPSNKGHSPEEVKELWRLKGMRTNDACFVYYNDQFDRFEYYAQWLVPAIPNRRVEADNLPNLLRCIQRRFSVDGLTWSSPELIIMPDERDPWDLQFYHLAVQWHEDWMIGSLGHYRVEAEQQTQDLELVFSRDGRHWHRPLRGGFIPRDPDSPDAHDSMGVYPPNAWIDEGNTWLCLYTGAHLRHNEVIGKDPSKTSPIMGARWKKNRFVGVGAGDVVGGFLSEPFYPQQAEITIDADIRGWLRAEFCDVFGRKHDGYHLMDAVTVTGDSTAHVLQWKGRNTAGFQHDAVRLRFEFADGKIYSIGF